MRVLIFICFVISMSYSAHGIGMGRESGGGSYALIDGRIVISDPYYAGVPASKIDKITPASFHDLPKEVRDYVSQIERFLLKYAISFRVDRLPDSDPLAKFFNEVVRTEAQEYFLVPASRENNVPCEHYLPKLNREVDDHFQYGCTFATHTYLFVDKWRQASIENQAYAIIHERMWAANPQADQRDIATFVGWTQKFETRYVQQIQFNDRSLLSEKEMEGYSEWFQAAQKLGLGFFLKDTEFSVLPGGGLIRNTCPGRIQVLNSFVGVGTLLSVSRCKARLSIENSVILASFLKDDYFSEEKTYIVNNSTIIDSDLERNFIKDSKLFATNVENSLLTHSTVSHSDLDKTTSIQSEIVNSKTRDAQIHSSQVSNSELDSVHTTFGIIKNSPQAAGMTLNGTSDSLVSVDQVATFLVGHVVIESGSILKNVKFLTVGDADFLKTVKIGKNAVVDNILFDSIWSDSHNGHKYATFDLVVEPQTKIRNGQITFNPRCKISANGQGAVPSRSANSFFIGTKGFAREYQLSNKVVNIKTGRFSCSARFE